MKKISEMIDVKDSPKIELSEEERKKKLKERLQGFCDKINATHKESKEVGIDCPKCNNNSFVLEVRDYENGNSDIVAISCSCSEKRRWVKKAMDNGFANYLLLRSNNYICKTLKQKERKSLIINFCQNHGMDDKWLTILGNPGSGKTLLACVVANHLLYNLGRKVLYVTWTDFIARIKRYLLNQEIEAFERDFKEVKEAEVLFIDELIKNYTEADLRYVIEIINYRYANNLKTIITSERSKYDLVRIDQATFSRVIEKSKSFIIEIPHDISENYRLQDN